MCCTSLWFNWGARFLVVRGNACQHPLSKWIYMTIHVPVGQCYRMDQFEDATTSHFGTGHSCWYAQITRAVWEWQEFGAEMQWHRQPTCFKYVETPRRWILEIQFIRLILSWIVYNNKTFLWCTHTERTWCLQEAAKLLKIRLSLRFTASDA